MHTLSSAHNRRVTSNGFNVERSSGYKSLAFPSMNAQEGNLYSDREKRLLIQNVEDKFSTNSIERYNRSQNITPNLLQEGKMNTLITALPEGTPSKPSKQNVIDLNVRELKDNFEKIPRHIKFQKKLIPEVETMQFSLFLGLSNLELLQEEDNLKEKSTNSKVDVRSAMNKSLLEPAPLKVSAPRHMCSLFQDINDLFEKVVEQYPRGESQQSNSARSLHEAGRFDVIDEEMIDIHQKFRSYVTYLQNETGFMNAITLDLLWKSLYIKYEQCFVKLQRRFEKETVTLRGFVKEQFAKQEQMLLDFAEERKEIQRRHEEAVKQMAIALKEMQVQRERMEEQMDLSKLELETLTRFDKRKEAMLDVEGAFDKLNSYIGEIDGKKKKTITMLRKLQILMEADRGKLSKVSCDVQTDESHL